MESFQNSDRVQLLYLDRQGTDDPGFFAAGFSPPRREPLSITPRTHHRTSEPRISRNIPTTCSSTVQSTIRSRRTSFASTASSASTVDTIPPVHPLPTLNQQIAMTPFIHRYYLPCEFNYIGCNLHFAPPDSDYWIEHSISHFTPSPPPPESKCLFCNAHPFKSHTNPLSAWRNRMLHIEQHLQNLQPNELERPDFLTIDYMWQQNLISSEDYASVIKYTERPTYPGRLVPNDYQTEDMKRRSAKEERNSLEYHNLRNEDKLKKKRGYKKANH